MFIARKPALAESTVKIHVQRVLRKLNLSGRVQAAVFGVERRHAVRDQRAPGRDDDQGTAVDPGISKPAT